MSENNRIDHKETQLNEESWSQFLSQQEEAFRNWRRDLHQYPEVGWTEYRTTFRLGEE